MGKSPSISRSSTPTSKKRRARTASPGEKLNFKGTDIVDGAELLWDPAILDQMFHVIERHPDDVAEDALREQDRSVILRRLDLWSLIRKTLTPRQYQILEHLLLHGYSVVQIADLLQVKQPVVSMLIRTALDKLRRTPLIKSLRYLF